MLISFFLNLFFSNLKNLISVLFSAGSLKIRKQQHELTQKKIKIKTRDLVIISL